jgi:hypothetical protein
MEQFRDRQVGELVVDRRAEEDDPLVEEARIDVEGALAVHGLLDHHRNQRAHKIIGLSLVEFLYVELGRGVGHLVLPSQLLPPGNAGSSERLFNPGALAAKKVAGCFELHLASAVFQTARHHRAISPGSDPLGAR